MDGQMSARSRTQDRDGFRSERRPLRKGFSSLTAYWEREKHCRVPGGHIDDDGYRLGTWVSKQRGNQAKLSEDRRRRLDELGFVWKARNIQ